jgi:hypothetical protein
MIQFFVALGLPSSPTKRIIEEEIDVWGGGGGGGGEGWREEGINYLILCQCSSLFYTSA